MGDSTRLWRPDLWRGLSVEDGLESIIEEAARLIEEASRGGNVVFCPPVATFLDDRSAAENNLCEGLAILVDCDDKCSPREAFDKLAELLGPATMVVASGGVTNGEDKLHLYWRLKGPSKTPEEHALLRWARTLAAQYVGADTTSGPACHPIRWAGSWHMKAEPRLAKVVAKTENEVDLATAVALLREAVGAREDAERHSGIGEADIVDVASALEVIPNEDLDWEGWNKLGMAVWRATSGSDDGLALWATWSAKSRKNVVTETAARWRHYRHSPPDRIGAGTLFHLARVYKPDWKRPTEVVPAFSNEGLALRMAARYGDELRYTEDWGKWHHWTGSYWREDKTLVSVHLAREVCRGAAREANKPSVAMQLASARTVNAVTTLVKADRKVAAVTTQWDSDPWLLGSPGGTWDLQRGTMMANGIDNYITRVLPVTPEGDCPAWLTTLGQIFAGDREMIDYVQRICGYCLTGSVREEQMFFLHGEGGNGKGTFIETFAAAMGSLATTVGMNTLIQTKNTEHPTEIAKLFGVRLAVASETVDGARWNAAKIKLLTGSDQLTGRFMRGNYFDFYPTHKLTVSSNRKPLLGRVDNAIVRRTVLIPFLVSFVGVEDKRLKERLRAEKPGILMWAIQGCLIWQRWGMAPPASVQRATSEYLHDQDDIQVFVEECCEILDNVRTPSTVLYNEWKDWCERNGAYVGSSKDFTQRLSSKFETRKVHNLTNFYGLRLIPKGPEPPGDRMDDWDESLGQVRDPRLL
jgi:putative DNA primase/helicase